MFWKNFRRDFSSVTSRLISVVIITAVAVMIHISLSNISYNTLEHTNNYFDEQNVADYWISGAGFTRNDCNKIESLDSVIDVEPRVVFDFEDKSDSNITLTVYSISDEIKVNLPYIVEGNIPKTNREIMISDEFAKVHNLKMGDAYEIKLSGTNRTIRTTISALIKNPECLFHINASNSSPDYSKYGFAYIPEGAVSDILGDNTYNQICITTQDGISKTEINKEIIDILNTKVVNILALEDNMNAYNTVNLMDGIKSIIMIFPIIFFLIAMLIMFSTMSRLIENSRTNIGTFKALGYSDTQIKWYYLLYAVFVVVAGYIIGAIPANALLTKPISDILFSSADTPKWPLEFKPSALVTAFMLVCVICIGTAYYITSKTLRERPAECMRPKAPPAAKKILPEKIPALWNKFNFTQKYIVRNMFRNKSRMIISIIGIMGCTTLVVTALGINDTVHHYLDTVETNQLKYDYTVNFKNNITPAQYRHFEKLDCVSDIEYQLTTGVKLFSDTGYESSYFYVTEDSINLKMINVYGPPQATLPSDGIILDENLAENLGVLVGDNIKIKFTGDNNFYEAKIAEIHPCINNVYAGRSFWRSLGKEYLPTSAYMTTDDPNYLNNLLSDYDFVDSYSVKDDMMKAIRTQVDTMLAIVYILIFFGGVLALIVLYNLGIISFHEQIRNLATLMVLGFRNKEIKKLVLTENIVFSIVGIIAGIPIGRKLSEAILGSIGTLHFETYITLWSYVIAGILTLSFTMIVNVMLSKKMKNIDMLGALKSVE